MASITFRLAAQRAEMGCQLSIDGSAKPPERPGSDDRPLSTGLLPGYISGPEREIPKNRPTLVIAKVLFFERFLRSPMDRLARGEG